MTLFIVKMGTLNQGYPSLYKMALGFDKLARKPGDYLPTRNK